MRVGPRGVVGECHQNALYETPKRIHKNTILQKITTWTLKPSDVTSWIKLKEACINSKRLSLICYVLEGDSELSFFFQCVLIEIPFTFYKMQTFLQFC